MKRKISIISVIVISLIVTSFNCNHQNKLKTGFYYLAESEISGELINDIDSEDIFAVDRQEILNTSDLIAAKLVLKNYKPKSFKAIELKLNANGKKKWFKIKDRISKSGESIVFICNDKIYFQKSIGRNTKLESSEIDLYVDEKYIEKILDIINSEISDSR